MPWIYRTGPTPYAGLDIALTARSLPCVVPPPAIARKRRTPPAAPLRVGIAPSRRRQSSTWPSLLRSWSLQDKQQLMAWAIDACAGVPVRSDLVRQVPRTRRRIARTSPIASAFASSAPRLAWPASLRRRTKIEARAALESSTMFDSLSCFHPSKGYWRARSSRNRRRTITKIAQVS